jgi:glutamate dehydrogenase (NADP+)
MISGEELSFSARMNASLEEMNLQHQQPRGHGLVGVPQGMVASVREMSEEIDLEMGGGDDDPSGFSHATQALVGVHHHHHHHEDSEERKHLMMMVGHPDELAKMGQQPRKKKKVVKKWRDEWADTYKWAYVAIHEGSHRIFCSICKEFGRKHRRNPYGNEGSRNMQMSALEEHNNSLLHKEALRLQLASKDKNVSAVDRPVYIKG